jgi:hypothetical protein
VPTVTVRERAYKVGKVEEAKGLIANRGVPRRLMRTDSDVLKRILDSARGGYRGDYEYRIFSINERSKGGNRGAPRVTATTRGRELLQRLEGKARRV